ncbi:PQQ-binding-like beta-propeller repeat protein [Halobacterium sp. CBA1126]|uniref:PQQ-binding-like beta-propeller repeat protein n=1 Tax=Halobacterium sp. CBA1126 TaxID=2668074 RepID=UPI0012FA16AC|nr:PQQ-binding-like beta-propeller repeat protein [Halobacterium sp. CBA1126]MUV60142.1 PQQ-binding-like beta-propeller repeat protein [Halobacterium sp. CBA1126]
MRSPSRRDVLAATGGALAGLAGGYVARPYVDADSVPDPAPFAWADTEWPYPDYDPQRSRNPPPESAPDGDLAERWRYPASGRRPEVAVANGRAVLSLASSSIPRLASLDAATGDEHWNVPTGGSRETPVAAPGDRVFTKGRGRDVLASRAAATGEALWSTTTTGVGEPFLGGGRQYVLGVGVDGETVRALNARTGDRLWTAGLPSGHFPAAAYDADADRVVVGTDDEVVCLDAADGSTVWTEERSGNAFVSGPAVAGGRVFHAAFQAGVTALDADSGDVLWDEPFDPELRDAEDPQVARYFVVGAATGSVLLAVEQHGDARPEQLVAFDAASGDRLWRTDFDRETSVSRSTIVDGAAYASVGSEERTELVRFDLADGAATDAWPLPTYGGPPVVADGWVYVPTSEGVVALR